MVRPISGMLSSKGKGWLHATSCSVNLGGTGSYYMRIRNAVRRKISSIYNYPVPAFVFYAFRSFLGGRSLFGTPRLDEWDVQLGYMILKRSHFAHRLQIRQDKKCLPEGSLKMLKSPCHPQHKLLLILNAWKSDWFCQAITIRSYEKAGFFRLIDSATSAAVFSP